MHGRTAGPAGLRGQHCCTTPLSASSFHACHRPLQAYAAPMRWCVCHATPLLREAPSQLASATDELLRYAHAQCPQQGPLSHSACTANQSTAASTKAAIATATASRRFASQHIHGAVQRRTSDVVQVMPYTPCR